MGRTPLDLAKLFDSHSIVDYLVTVGEYFMLMVVTPVTMTTWYCYIHHTHYVSEIV